MLHSGALAKPVAAAQVQDICQKAIRAKSRAGAPPVDWVVDDLHAAITEGHFVAYLQPQVDLRRGGVVGFEALARWDHPSRGLLAPDRFIQRVERLHLMAPVTISIARSAVNTFIELKRAGFDGRLSINIASGCFDDADFSNDLERVVLNAGAACDDVTLELVETDDFHDSVLEISALARLRLAGFHLAADDFGTGCSTLSKLQRGAYDEVKIDREFTQRAQTDRAGQAAVASILVLAKEMGASCVAEGIEDESTLAFLVKRGCQVGQGYLFSAPLPPGQTVDWWRQWAHAVKPLPAMPDGEVSKPATLDASDLERLSRREQPIWIF